MHPFLSTTKHGCGLLLEVQEGRIEAILSKFEEKIARSEQLRLAHLASVVQRANDETRKVRGSY